MDNDKFVGWAVALFLAAVGTLLSGWAISVVWGWFIVPVFSAPPLTIAQALGVGIVGSLLSPTVPKGDIKDKDWTELISSALAQSIVAPLITLVLAWIIKGFL